MSSPTGCLYAIHSSPKWWRISQKNTNTIILLVWWIPSSHQSPTSCFTEHNVNPGLVNPIIMPSPSCCLRRFQSSPKYLQKISNIITLNWSEDFHHRVFTEDLLSQMYSRPPKCDRFHVKPLTRSHPTIMSSPEQLLERNTYQLQEVTFIGILELNYIIGLMNFIKSYLSSGYVSLSRGLVIDVDNNLSIWTC